MPITRLPNGKLLYFAHVAKCAGSAVTRYLATRFGPVGLQDSRHTLVDADASWSRTSPQHMPEALRRDILPDPLFDGCFATVRHPARRLVSVYRFQREIEGRIPAALSFPGWLASLPRQLALAPYALDGHIRPMAETVPEGAQVFALEDGLAPLVDWLDAQAGTADGPREIAPVNVLADRLEGAAPPPSLTRPVLETIAQIYAADYARFDYPVDPQERERTT